MPQRVSEACGGDGDERPQASTLGHNALGIVVGAAVEVASKLPNAHGQDEG